MSKIRIITETLGPSDGSDTRTRGFSDFVGGVKAASLEVDANALTKDMKEVYTTMVNALAELQDINPAVELKDVQFTLGIDTMGQVSLFSAVSGSNVTKTGITFNLSFKK